MFESRGSFVGNHSHNIDHNNWGSFWLSYFIHFRKASNLATLSSSLITNHLADIFKQLAICKCCGHSAESGRAPTFGGGSSVFHEPHPRCTLLQDVSETLLSRVKHPAALQLHQVGDQVSTGQLQVDEELLHSTFDMANALCVLHLQCVIYISFKKSGPCTSWILKLDKGLCSHERK